MYVLIVVAHPDDAEIAMGMRIRWYADNGARVRVHCLTTGLPTANGGDTRRQECRAAGAELGVQDYTFSEIPDTCFTSNRSEIHTELFRVFTPRRPDIVYTHFPRDQHLDHTTTAHEVTAVALREANDLIYFRSPYSLGFEPTMIFMGTAHLLAAKKKALTCFTSQHQLDMTTFTTLAQVVHRQHLHHRVIERLPPHAVTAELFTIARRVEVATSGSAPGGASQ